MSLQNKNAIDKEYSANNRSKIQRKKLIQMDRKKGPNSIDSIEPTNTETNENKKQKDKIKLFSHTESGSESERLNKFIEKKTKREDTNKIKKRKEDIKDKRDYKNKSNNITLINLDESESDSESKEDLNINENMNENFEEKKQRTIFIKTFGEKIKESDLNHIFKDYGIILKVKKKSDYSYLIEFKDKSSANKVFKTKLFFQGKQVNIQVAKDIISDKIKKDENEKESIENIIKNIEEKQNKEKNKVVKESQQKSMRNKIVIERYEKKETKKEETYLDIEKEKTKNDGEESAIPKILEVLNNLTGDVQNLKNVVKEQDDKMKKQDKKIKEQDDKMKKQDKKIKEQNDKMKKQDKKIKEQNDKIKEQYNKIENQNIIINIMNDIDNQKDIYYKTTINGINKKVKLIMNSYKILYMRKLANLLLQKIYKKYSHFLGKTYIEYGNKKEKKKVDVIAVLPNIKKLDTVESYNINLLIDFLRFVWKKCSTGIHINDENFPFQKEILYEYLNPVKKINNKKIVNNNLEKSMKIKEIINLIFEENNERDENSENIKILESDLVKEIKNKIKEGLILNKTEENINKINFEEEDILTISSSESDDDFGENEIKNIIQKSVNEVDLSLIIKKLFKLIKANQKSNNNIIDNIIDINGEYLYNLWKRTFIDEEYKKKEEYKKYNVKKKIPGLKDMGLIVCTLFGEDEIDLFINDPKKVNNIIKNSYT